MTKELLLSIFGDEALSLTEKEIAVANKVALWFHSPSLCSPNNISESEQRLLNACRFALEKEGVSWSSIMLNRTRKKEVVGYRDAIISIVWERTYGTQAHKVYLLGDILTRATIIHAVNTTKDWIKYDTSFRDLYNKLLESIENYLND